MQKEKKSDYKIVTDEFIQENAWYIIVKTHEYMGKIMIMEFRVTRIN